MSTKTATIDPERQMLGEVEVIGQDRWEEIRRRAGEGASIRTIARELDLDRKTVRRCLRQTEWKPYQRAARTDTLLHVTRRTNLARFPFIKGLDSFDFGYQPSVDRKQIQKLSLCHFVEHGENLVLLGPPGVGKTHLAVGLGLKAIEHGYRVLFTTVAAMLTTLTKALNEGRFDDKLKVFTIQRLLIIDEIGSPADRPADGDAVPLAHRPALRAGADDPDQQPELRELGRRLRGPRDRPVRSSTGFCITRRRSASGAIRIG